MGSVYVHPRVNSRHPELKESDILSAWHNAIELVRRETKEGARYVAVGSDANGRLVEMVACRAGDDYLVFHAMTPPSKKTLRETGLQRR